MKSKLLIIAVTAVTTWITANVAHGVRSGVERLWLISAIKVPGRMAIEEIQADMAAGRYEMATAKLQAFLDTWQRFNHGPDSFGGRGIGDVMSALAQAEIGPHSARSEPTKRVESNETTPASGHSPHPPTR